MAVSGEIGSYPGAAQRAYIVATIFVAGIFGFLDRQIISLLLVPIRSDLHLNNTQVSLLYGFAFVVLFSTAGLFIGGMVDRYHRRSIMAAGVAIWSVATICCGLAPSFGWLFLARIAVGMGEACLAPAACSILADSFTPQYRSRALFSYMLGAFVGLGASMAIGGALFQTIEQHGLSLFGLTSWRLVFVLIGLPGILIAVMAQLMNEPARKGVACQGTETASGLISYLARHWRVLGAIFIAQSAMAFSSYGIHAWLPSYFIRRFGLPVADVGTTMGLLLAVGGIVGAFASVQLSDRWTLAGVPAAKLRVTALGALAALPAVAAFPWATQAWQAWACTALLVTASPFASSTATIMTQDLFPNRMRGQGTALMLLSISLFGTSLGPLTVGLLIDRLGDTPQHMAEAMSLSGAPALILVVMSWLLCRGRYDDVRLPIFRADRGY